MPHTCLIANITTALHQYVLEHPNKKLSIYLRESVGYNYTYMSNTFAKVTGKPIIQYIINLKIERAKELIRAEQNFSGSQIANLLHYSSEQHFSNQFKKLTGITPSQFKRHKAIANDMVEAFSPYNLNIFSIT